MASKMVSTLLKVIKEGTAVVNFPKEVFYNPVQEFNRDLTICVINEFNKMRNKKVEKDRTPGELSGLKILEALSATGLRSVRFAKEVTNISKIVANDIDPVAVELIKENIESNNVKEIIDVTCGDANLIMYQTQEKFHVVDIDPYGSASRFLDAAVQSLINGGLLCVTCTDAAVLCGAALGTSLGKYGSVAIGSRLASSHEMGIRILLHSIQSAASRHGLYIEPVLSLSVDFYFRVFVRVFEGPSVVKAIAVKLGMVYLCAGCQTHHIQPLGTSESDKHGNRKVRPAEGPVVGQTCDQCGGHFILGGPMWTAPIHDTLFCDQLVANLPPSISTRSRIIGMVTVAKEELTDVPLYYEVDKLARTVRSLCPPSISIRSAILHAGYRVSSSHCSPVAMKTDAPPSVLWDLFTSFVKSSGRFESLLADDRTSKHAKAILARESSIEANFERHAEADPQSRRAGLVRFQENPLPNWGPKPKASRLA